MGAKLTNPLSKGVQTGEHTPTVTTSFTSPPAPPAIITNTGTPNLMFDKNLSTGYGYGTTGGGAIGLTDATITLDYKRILYGATFYLTYMFDNFGSLSGRTAVQISTDGINWTNVSTDTGNQTIIFSAFQFRYLRFWNNPTDSTTVQTIVYEVFITAS